MTNQSDNRPGASLSRSKHCKQKLGGVPPNVATPPAPGWGHSEERNEETTVRRSGCVDFVVLSLLLLLLLLLRRRRVVGEARIWQTHFVAALYSTALYLLRSSIFTLNPRKSVRKHYSIKIPPLWRTTLLSQMSRDYSIWRFIWVDRFLVFGQYN